VEQVIDRVWTGDNEDFERNRGKPGWSFLRCCKDGPGGHRELLGYHTMGAPKGATYLWVKRGPILALNLIDVDDPKFVADEMIKTGLAFVAARHKDGDKVLIACNAGHSRGPTTTLLYLRTIGEMPHNFLRSEHIFRTLYRKYDPGTGMRQFARSHWDEYGRQEINGVDRRPKS
jgi:hypothetical protein